MLDTGCSGDRKQRRKVSHGESQERVVFGLFWWYYLGGFVRLRRGFSLRQGYGGQVGETFAYATGIR